MKETYDWSESRTSCYARLSSGEAGEAHALSPMQIGILEEIKRQVLIDLLLYSASSRIYMGLNSMLALPGILISGVLSITSLRGEDPSWRIAGMVLGASSAGLGALSRHMNAGETAQKYGTIVRQLQSLRNDISTRLTFRATPVSPTEYIDRVHREFDLIHREPLEPSLLANLWFLRRFQRLDETTRADFEKLVVETAQGTLDCLDRRLTFVRRSGPSSDESAGSNNPLLSLQQRLKQRLSVQILREPVSPPASEYLSIEMSHLSDRSTSSGGRGAGSP